MLSAFNFSCVTASYMLSYTSIFSSHILYIICSSSVFSVSVPSAYISRSLIFFSSSTSALSVCISLLEYSGVSSSLSSSGSWSIITSLAYPKPLYDVLSTGLLPFSENLSLMLIKRDTIVLSRPYSTLANSITLVYADHFRISVSLASFNK